MNVSNYLDNYFDFSLSLFDCRASILLGGVEFLVLNLLIMIGKGGLDLTKLKQLKMIKNILNYLNYLKHFKKII